MINDHRNILSLLKTWVYLQEQLLIPCSDHKIDFWFQKKVFFSEKGDKDVQRSVILYPLNNFSLRKNYNIVYKVFRELQDSRGCRTFDPNFIQKK